MGNRKGETDRYTNTAKQLSSSLLNPVMSWCQALIFSDGGSSKVVAISWWLMAVHTFIVQSGQACSFGVIVSGFGGHMRTYFVSVFEDSLYLAFTVYSGIISQLLVSSWKHLPQRILFASHWFEASCISLRETLLEVKWSNPAQARTAWAECLGPCPGSFWKATGRRLHRLWATCANALTYTE